MIELPEAVNLAEQLNETVSGKRISGVIAGHTPHKLVWYYGDPARYASLLVGKTVDRSVAYGGMIETTTSGDGCILLGEGSNIRFHHPQEPRPAVHQLLIEFDDGCALSSAVRMYGGMGCYPAGELDNKYYKVAKEKPSPLSPAFDRHYFEQMLSAPEAPKLSLKALLATDQRIPGLGNGVLQDILFHARFHPKKKLSSLSGPEKDTLYNSVKTVLQTMVESRGRDTELDLFGRSGGYKTVLSKNAVGKPCPICGTTIKKEAYLGGSIYYCAGCQPI